MTDMDQKAQEMTTHEKFLVATVYESGHASGIIEGRKQAFKEAAKVAEKAVDGHVAFTYGA
jgi:hypothetical protein